MPEQPVLVIAGGDVVRRQGTALTVSRADVVVAGGSVTAIVGEGEETPAAGDRIDARGCLVIPGLVNAHTHSYGALGRGYVDGLPLEPWMVYANAFTVNRTPEEVALAARVTAMESIRNGTTTILDHLGGAVSDVGHVAQAYVDVGLRAVVSPMFSDVPLHRTVATAGVGWSDGVWERLEEIPVADPNMLLRDVKRLYEEWDGRADLVRVFLGPSAPQRCSKELLAACSRLADELDTGVHTHLLESRNQAMLGQQAPDGSFVAYLDEVGLLSPRFSGAHGIWCTDAELRLLADRGAALVHNPWSNLILGSGIAPLLSWREHGVPAALGSDGANCGGDLRMPLAMRLAATLHRGVTTTSADWPTPGEVFDLATTGGARVLGLQDRIGSIEVGMDADLAVIEMTGPAYVPRHEPLTQLVLGETGAGVRDVVIAGRQVLRDRVFVTIDERTVLDQAQRAAEAVVERNAELFNLAERQAATLTVAADRSPVPDGWSGRLDS